MSTLGTRTRHFPRLLTESLAPRPRVPAGSALAFGALALYIATQCFTVPIYPLGPSWALWPTLPDLAIGAFALASLLAPGPARPMEEPRRDVLAAYIGLGLATVFSFLVVTMPAASSDVGYTWGAYEVLRTVQFALVLWLACRIEMTEERRRILAGVSLATFFAVAAGIFATRLDLVKTEVFAPFLPRTRPALGAWSHYVFGWALGVGTIGYNHAYVSSQAILLAALALSLLRGSVSWLRSAVLVTCVLACFASGSRAGLVASLCLVASQVPRLSLSLPLFAGAAIVALLGFGIASGDDQSELWDRQVRAFRPDEGDNLSGRDDIWRGRLEELNEKPHRWIMGAGVGGVAESGSNAHNVFLQVVGEMGFIGLCIFGRAMYACMSALWLRERGGRPLFWGTAALLVASLTQETFSPLPLMGHFLGFYLCAVAVAVGRPAERGKEAT